MQVHEFRRRQRGAAGNAQVFRLQARPVLLDRLPEGGVEAAQAGLPRGGRPLGEQLKQPPGALAHVISACRSGVGVHALQSDCDSCGHCRWARGSLGRHLDVVASTVPQAHRLQDLTAAYLMNAPYGLNACGAQRKGTFCCKTTV